MLARLLLRYDIEFAARPLPPLPLSLIMPDDYFLRCYATPQRLRRLRRHFYASLASSMPTVAYADAIFAAARYTFAYSCRRHAFVISIRRHTPCRDMFTGTAHYALIAVPMLLLSSHAELHCRYHTGNSAGRHVA